MMCVSLGASVILSWCDFKWVKIEVGEILSGRDFTWMGDLFKGNYLMWVY